MERFKLADHIMMPRGRMTITVLIEYPEAVADAFARRVVGAGHAALDCAYDHIMQPATERAS